MSKRVEEKAIDAWAIYEYREHPKGLYHTCFVDGYKEGYEQAEKDLALTPADIRQIVEIYDECLNLTFEEGKPAYESDGFYEEVLRRFIEKRGKK